MRGSVATIAFASTASFACADARPRVATDDTVAPDPAVPRLVRATPRRAFPTDGLDIVIARDRMLLGDVRVAKIVAGRVAADEVEHHRVAALAQQLRDAPPTVPVVIRADELTRFGAVIDAMYTAHGDGRDEFAIAVAPVNADGVAGVISVIPSRTWDHDIDEGVHDLVCFTVARVADATVELEVCGEAPSRFALDDAEGMRGHLTGPGWNHHVRVVADADAQWSSIVRVIDALGGPPWDHDAIDARTIRPHYIVLDLDPRIPWRAGRWDQLRVRLADIELIEYADRRRDRAALETRATAMIPALERCLRGSDELRLRVPDSITIVLATHPELGDVAFTADRSAPACVATLVAPLAPRIVEVVPGDAELHFAIDVPPE
ncbi:MAG: hypothetical protein IPK74_06755 [Deltaproteobacteria bacterium]|nr:hypothetical protein [Deltaproteobacteria bacterium]